MGKRWKHSFSPKVRKKTNFHWFFSLARTCCQGNKETAGNSTAGKEK